MLNLCDTLFTDIIGIFYIIAGVVMKYFILFCDGAADRKSQVPGVKTPLEAAVKPTFNMLSYRSFNGVVSSAPENAPLDVGTSFLSLLSFDPQGLTGFSPFDAARAGASLTGEDTVYKCSLVTLSDNGEPFDKKVLVDCCGDITDEEASSLVSALNKGLSTKIKKFYRYSGTEHRLVWRRAPEDAAIPSPCDVKGAAVGQYLADKNAAKIKAVVEKSFEVLNNCPVNEKRRESGKKPLNAVWLWEGSKMPDVEPFAEKWQLSSASLVTNSEKLTGIAKSAGIKTVSVGVDENGEELYDAEAQAAIKEFTDGADLVIVHTGTVSKKALEGDFAGKTAAIEAADSRILAPVYEYLCGCGDQFKLLVYTGLPAPCEDKAYVREPSPFFMYNSQRTEVGYKPFSETNARKGGFNLPDGYKFMSFMIRIPAPVVEETEENDGEQ